MNAGNSTRETELQIRGEEKIANFPLKAVPNLLVHGGRKIKMQHMKSKSYRLLFPEHFELETVVVGQLLFFLPPSALSLVFSSSISVSFNLFTSDLLQLLVISLFKSQQQA